MSFVFLRNFLIFFANSCTLVIVLVFIFVEQAEYEHGYEYEMYKIR